MTIPQNLRRRINYQGEFDLLLSDVCMSYGLGGYSSFEPIEMGYEDVNLKLITSKGAFFIKIFAESRSNEECLRLINIVKHALDNGVSHPRFLERDHGYIFRERYDDFNIRLSVFEYINGKTFFELQRKPDDRELKEIIKGAATINKIDYKPKEVYDSWAIVNFDQELEKARKYLSEKELKLLDRLQSDFKEIDMLSLPRSLVHGDLISTNIIKSGDKIYFVDFSVANYYPRIVELAVLMNDILFDRDGKRDPDKYLKILLSEYTKYLTLTANEITTLPLFIKLGHAMHFIRASREKFEGNDSLENDYWLRLGKAGLDQCEIVWK